MINHNNAQIWLSKNLERFKSITKSYFKGADLVVFSPNLSRETDINTCKDMHIPYLILSKNDVQSNNVLNLIENYPFQPKVKLKKEITITSEVIQNNPPYPGDGPDLYSPFYENDLNKSSQPDDLRSKQSLDK
ncbi:hypothetical protein L3V83_10480 [Thiotrichales bacterium 19X7-9]|nr:hypothetical protein [Thiotrichales bacterium 19X7-9]